MTDHKTRYRTVLKSSSLIGGAALINILIGMVKTKFVALWLGPSGVGLINLFRSIQAPVLTLSGMGLQTSGVRQIAEKSSVSDLDGLTKVVRTIRITCWYTGLLGSLLMVLLAPWFSRWTFGDTSKVLQVALLGVTILITSISNGQKCVIQGTRRIRDLASLQVIGAIGGVVFSLPLFYFFGESGILPSLIFLAILQLAVSWYYARKIPLTASRPEKSEVLGEAKKLLSFGIPLMLTGLQRALILYAVRLVLVNRFGADGVGQWAAAFGLSGILMNFVLQAMGADYYPRLTAVNVDHVKMRAEVNSQTHVALILALPALLATMLFAPLAVKIFYSGRFEEAIPILRWSIFGAFGRVITWPLGFIILAKGMGKIFFCTELLGHGAHFAFMWLLTGFFGLTGSGMAWAATYALYLLVVMVTAATLIHFRWSRVNTLWIAVSLFLLIAAFWMQRLPLGQLTYHGLSALLLLTVGLISLRELSRMSGWGLKSILGKI